MNALGSKISPIARNIVMAAMAGTMLVVPLTLDLPREAGAADGISTQTVASVAEIGGGGQFVVMRMVFDPGVTLAAHSHPGPASFVVISGTLQTTLVRGGAAVNRNGMEQVAELGATMNLSAGVVVSYSPNAVKTVANHGSEPLVLLAMMLLDPHEPMVAFEDSPAVLQLDLHR